MKLTQLLAGILMVLALALAVLAWVVGRQAPRQLAPEVAVPKAPPAAAVKAVESAPKWTIVVASQAIPAGSHLVKEQLKSIEVSKPIHGAFENLDDLIGRTTVVAMQVQQPLLEQHLVSGLTLQLESGQRAVAIAVKEPMAIGNHVRPGDFVDVFFTLQADGQHAPVEAQTRLLLARSRVLAYGTRTVENLPAAESVRKAESVSDDAIAAMQRINVREERRTEPANTAVLAVPLEDVQRLTLAERFGHLNLALRHPDDEAMPDPLLFAALPPALQPAGMPVAQASALPAADRAYAGLKFKDLAMGGGKTVVTTQPNVRSVSVKRQGVPTQVPPSREVELYSGSHLQTVRY